jgi:hypothetical protein
MASGWMIARTARACERPELAFFGIEQRILSYAPALGTGINGLMAAVILVSSLLRCKNVTINCALGEFRENKRSGQGS